MKKPYPCDRVFFVVVKEKQKCKKRLLTRKTNVFCGANVKHTIPWQINLELHCL